MKILQKLVAAGFCLFLQAHISHAVEENPEERLHLKRKGVDPQNSSYWLTIESMVSQGVVADAFASSGKLWSNTPAKLAFRGTYALGLGYILFKSPSFEIYRKMGPEK